VAAGLLKQNARFPYKLMQLITQSVNTKRYKLKKAKSEQ
jgi:hypothetical protein